jgi:glucan biosynthesis protein
LGAGRRGIGGNSLGAREQRQHRAFWRPAHGLPANHPAHFEYRITWLAEPTLPKGMGEVMATRSGASLDGKRRVFILDFVGAGDKIDGLHLDLVASTGKISNATLVSNAPSMGCAPVSRSIPTMPN